MSKSLICRVALILLLSTIAFAEAPYQEPRETFEAYLNACQEGDFEAAESCYTGSSRELVKKQTNPEVPRNPDVLTRTYEELKSVNFKEEKFSDTRAILWADNEATPPFLFRIQDPKEGWRIDYHFMSNYIQVKDDGWKWRNKRIFKIWKSRD